MATWLDELVDDVRARLGPDDEGTLWLLFLDRVDGEVIVATAFDGGLALRDSRIIENLVRIISEVPSPAVLVAVPRADGLPLAVDKELWGQLSSRKISDTELVDLLVIGVVDYWSARSSG